MAITVQMQTQVTELYVALFGRAPDSEGLGYWVGQLDAGTSLAQVAQDMYNTSPARAYYPLWMTNEQIATSFYENVLGRAPDAEGLAYWSAQLASKTPGQVISDMIAAVVGWEPTGDATLDALGAAAQDLFNNKVAVALYYATELNGGIAGATTALEGVTADSDTSTDEAIEAILESNGTIAGETYVLTSGTDTIPGTALNDTIIGATGTYNPGDTINGDGGYDKLFLDLTSNATPYDVGNVNSVEEVFVNTTESAADGADQVTMLMSNYTGLQKLVIEQSRADIDVQDLQIDVDIVIDDMAADVNINIDSQNALGDNDEIDVSVREFGASVGRTDSDRNDELNSNNGPWDEHSDYSDAEDAGSFQYDLTIDENIEIVNIEDKGTEGYESDLSIAGGFRELNIAGGVAGVDLTVWEVDSSNFNGFGGNSDSVTVDASAFAGNLTIDVDNVSKLTTAAGDDFVNADYTNGTDIATGDGHDSVHIGYDTSDEASAEGLASYVGGNIDTGSGNDDVVVTGNMDSATVTTGTGGDSVSVGGNMDWSSVDTGTGHDTVVVGDEVLYSSIDTGNGDDSVTVGEEVWSSTITTGLGADTVVIGADDAGGNDENAYNLAGNSSVDTGAGDDAVTIYGSITGGNLDDSTVTLGAGNDSLTVDRRDNDGNDEADGINGNVMAGNGDDTITVIGGTLGNDADIDGGAGDDIIIMQSGGDSGNADRDVSDLATVTGVETLSLRTYAYGNDGDDGDDFDVDLAAFDEALALVDIQDWTWNYGGEDSHITMNVDLGNLTTEAISVTSVYGNSDTEARILAGNTEDVDIDVHMADASGDDDTLTLTMYGVYGNADYIVDLDDDSPDDVDTEALMMDNADGDHDEYGLASSGAIENLTVINNETDYLGNDDDDHNIRELRLNNDNDDSTIADYDFMGTLTIGGNMDQVVEGYEAADTRMRDLQDNNVLYVTGVASETIDASAYAGDLNVTAIASDSYDWTLGSGDDVVNMIADDLDVNDTLDFGDGIDRLLVNESTSATPEADEVFGLLTSLEELQVVGNADGVLMVALDDDAMNTGINRVIVSGGNTDDGFNPGNDDADVQLIVGSDFDRDLRIEADNGVLEIINNSTQSDLDIYTDADYGGRDILIDVRNDTDVDVFVGINGNDAAIGDGQYGNTEGVLNYDFGYGHGNGNQDGEVELTLGNNDNVLDSIVLLDNNAGSSENGAIRVHVADNWADVALTIDGSQINDYDGNDNTGGLSVWGNAESDAELTVYGSDNDDTIRGGNADDVAGGVGDTIMTGNGDDNVDGAAGDDYIDLGLGDNTGYGGNGDDTILAGNGDDTAYGEDGDDTISLGDGDNHAEGDAGDDTITTGSGDDDVYGGNGDDSITAGNGTNWIDGGLGADDLTGGTGVDTFDYNLAADSTGLTIDVINGFEAGVDGDVLDLSGVAATSDSDLVTAGLQAFTGVTFGGTFANRGIAETWLATNTTTDLEVVYVQEVDGWYIYADSDASGDINTADLAIKMVGLTGTLTDLDNFA